MTPLLRSWLYPLGFGAGLFFGARFLIQWYLAEKEKRSVAPAIFWKLSIAGNFLLLVHSIIQIHLPLALLQSQHVVLSWRNLDLSSHKEPRGSFRGTIYSLAIAALITTLFFAWSNPEWISAPYSQGLGVIPKKFSLFIHALGMIGFGALSLRFWVQWWNAEHNKASEFGLTFWILSLVGVCVASLYFFLIWDPVNLIGPVLSFVPICRNLMLLDKKKPSTSPSIFIFVGEKSGEVLGKKIIDALREKRNDLQFFGVVGPSFGTSVEKLYSIEQFQAMGVSRILWHLPKLIAHFLKLKREILRRNPQALIFIDQPDFSMRLAKSVRKAGYSGKIIQVVAPTVWAWRPGRAKKFAETFDLMLTLFPFEVPYFTRQGLKTICIGHPLVEDIPPQVHSESQLLALFPGSRPQEVERNLPLQLEAAALYCLENPRTRVAVSHSNTDYIAFIQSEIAKIEKKTGLALPYELVPFEERYGLMQKADMAIAKCGTVTLELGLHKVPTLVTYEVSALDRFLAEYVFRLSLPYFSIVNILGGKELFAEFIRSKPDASALFRTMMQVTQDPSRRASLEQELEQLRCHLQGNVPPTMAAQNAILSLLHENTSP